jgi:hypothetical protein
MGGWRYAGPAKLAQDGLGIMAVGPNRLTGRMSSKWESHHADVHLVVGARLPGEERRNDCRANPGNEPQEPIGQGFGPLNGCAVEVVTALARIPIVRDGRRSQQHRSDKTKARRCVRAIAGHVRAAKFWFTKIDLIPGGPECAMLLALRSQKEVERGRRGRHKPGVAQGATVVNP